MQLECECDCCCCFLFILHSNAITSSILHIHCVCFCALFCSNIFCHFSIVKNCHFTTYWLWFFFVFWKPPFFQFVYGIFCGLLLSSLLVACTMSIFSCTHDSSICVSVSCLNFATTDGKHTSGVTILHRKNTTQLSSYFKSNFYCISFLFLCFRHCCVCSILLTYLFIPLNSHLFHLIQ